jgi:hypothetical protein
MKRNPVTKISLLIGGFDTTSDEHAGLLNHRHINKMPELPEVETIKNDLISTL